MIKTVLSYADGSLRVSSAAFGSLRIVGTIADVTLNFVMHSDDLYNAIFHELAGDGVPSMRFDHARQVVYAMAMIQLEELREEGFA